MKKILIGLVVILLVGVGVVAYIRHIHKSESSPAAVAATQQDVIQAQKLASEVDSLKFNTADDYKKLDNYINSIPKEDAVNKL